MKKLDLMGHVYKKLTVVRVTTDKRGKRAWLCRCECGNETIVSGISLRRGNTGSCGCAQGDAKDETGKRYGRWAVIGRAESKDLSASWLCRCDCGNEGIVRGWQLRSGTSQSCGCLRIERLIAATTKPYGTSARNRAIAQTKANARKRGYEWCIDDPEAIQLMEQNCFYCGATPKQVCKGRNGNFTYNGLDRKDNGKGYTLENVVPCCIACNEAKRTKTVDEFLDLVRRVYNHSISKGE